MIDIEPRRMIYNRTGNFSQTTALDTNLAEQFMRASDLRLDVVITDSDRKPEQSSVSVGSDVLAWRSIVPLSELTKIVLRPKKYHQMQVIDGQYRIQIHDQIIDGDIRNKKPESAKDYEQQYLARLRGEVKTGLVETIKWEKLGLRAQLPNYVPYAFALSYLPSDIALGPHAVAILVGATILGLHPLYAFTANAMLQRRQQLEEFIHESAPDFRMPLPPCINPRDWKHALMPTVPVDKWFKGRRFLAQHGNDLIVARS